MSTKNGCDSIWLREFLVSKAKSCIPISSVCNARCIFCSNYHNPFELPQSEFRQVEDIRKNIQIADLCKVIRLCENIPGRIKEGESLLHPHLWQILQMIRDRHPKTIIVFATNGSMLTENFILTLSLFKPVAIDTLSINSSNKTNWLKLSGMKEHYANIAINSPRLLSLYQIPFTASLVAMPLLTGYSDIEETMRYVAQYRCSTFYLWLPGFTKYTMPSVQENMTVDLSKLNEISQKISAETNMQVCIFPSDVDRGGVKQMI